MFEMFKIAQGKKSMSHRLILGWMIHNDKNTWAKEITNSKILDVIIPTSIRQDEI